MLERWGHELHALQTSAVGQYVEQATVYSACLPTMAGVQLFCWGLSSGLGAGPSSSAAGWHHRLKRAQSVLHSLPRVFVAGFIPRPLRKLTGGNVLTKQKQQ